MRRIALALIFAGSAAAPLAGCAEDPSAAAASGAVVAGEPAGTPPGDSGLAVTSPTEPAAAPGHETPTAGRFVAHEWGTYTSVEDADGDSMLGLHHEEEPLPAFVDRRCFGCQSKSLETLPEAVTQKLETPVIYFYSDVARDVTVDVRFPEGLLSEYYPRPVAYAPAFGEALAVADGQLTWQVTVDPAIDPATFPEVDADDIWAPSRRTTATPLRAGAETERFIFYRGLGRFEVPFRVRATTADAVELRNDSAEPIAAAFVLRVTDAGAAMSPAVALSAFGRATVPVPAAPGKSVDGAFVPADRGGLLAALVASGLTSDESVAMLDTWERSYFRTPGVRVLYVAPRAWTDALLPITITPAPDELVRTLVGRVEVTTLPDELDLVQRLADMQVSGETAYGVVAALFDAHGRLVEARLRAAARHIDDPALAAFAAAAIDEASGPFFNIERPLE
ncbi:MAG: hypothetical protein KC635_10545 [Myxococcales bacterium]|nr:hypothetical protein [Myxococcales bacterium]MCB9731327.1 hypothetical protein [Deltaproteobacteria bacterium]